jgi:hypothetical protein
MQCETPRILTNPATTPPTQMPNVVEPTSVRIHSAAPRAQPGRATVSVRLDSIQDRLYTVVQEIDDRQDALAEFVTVAGVLTNAQCAAHYEVDAAGKVTAGPARMRHSGGAPLKGPRPPGPGPRGGVRG